MVSNEESKLLEDENVVLVSSSSSLLNQTLSPEEMLALTFDFDFDLHLLLVFLSLLISDFNCCTGELCSLSEDVGELCIL
jgi:hypothetical protein